MQDRKPASVLSPEGFCFIINLDTTGEKERLEFQLMPDTITEGKTANYDNIPIIGRSLPYLGYSHSSPRQINLSLEFAALTRGESDADKYTPQWVQRQVRWLEAKVYPKYDDNWVYPPPRLLIVIGEAVGMTAVMTSCNTTWLKPWYRRNNQVFPMRAQVDCAFEEWGYNNDEYGHPFSVQEAEVGANQPYREGSGATEYFIPGQIFITPGGGGFF